MSGGNIKRDAPLYYRTFMQILDELADKPPQEKICFNCGGWFVSYFNGRKYKQFCSQKCKVWYKKHKGE